MPDTLDPYQAWLISNQQAQQRQQANQAGVNAGNPNTNGAQQNALQLYMFQLQMQQQQAMAQQALQQQALQQQAMQAQQGQANNVSMEYQKKVDQANQANKDRYNDILSGRENTRKDIVNQLDSYGQSQINDATDRNKALGSQMNANIYSRGFGGSPSMLNSAARSTNNALNRDLNQINDNIINRRTSADASLSDQLYNFMERRNDVPPDLSQLIALQQGLGRSSPMLGAPSGGFAGAVPAPSSNQPFGFGMPPSSNAGFSPTTGAFPGNQQLGFNFQPPPMPGGLTNGFGRTNSDGNNYVRQNAAGAPWNYPMPVAGGQAAQPNGYDIYKQEAAKEGGGAARQLPWNYGNYPGANPTGQVQPFTSGSNGQVMPLQQPMPALGIFGARTQPQYGPAGPYGTPGGGLAPTPVLYGPGGPNGDRPYRPNPGSNPYYQQRQQHPGQYLL